MRITVSTVGIFFFVLAGLGILSFGGTPRYYVHLRISLGFLAFFLTLGIWHSERPRLIKLGVTLFALPLLLQALAMFSGSTGFAFLRPAEMLDIAHAAVLVAMVASPIFLVPRPWKGRQLLAALMSGLILGVLLTYTVYWRFDLVQAIAYYGLNLDLTGVSSSAEHLQASAMVMAFSSLFVAVAGCVWAGGPSRLMGTGLAILAVAGLEMSAAKPALYTLCGLLALATASVPRRTSVKDPLPQPGAALSA
jgi:hypothetical protein